MILEDSGFRKMFKRDVFPYKLIYRYGPPMMVVSINEEFIERPVKIKP